MPVLGPVRVIHDAEKTTLRNRRKYLLERDATFRFERKTLIGVPSDGLHVRDITPVCLMYSTLARRSNVAHIRKALIPGRDQVFRGQGHRLDICPGVCAPTTVGLASCRLAQACPDSCGLAPGIAAIASWQSPLTYIQSPGAAGTRHKSALLRHVRALRGTTEGFDRRTRFLRCTPQIPFCLSSKPRFRRRVGQ